MGVRVCGTGCWRRVNLCEILEGWEGDLGEGVAVGTCKLLEMRGLGKIWLEMWGCGKKKPSRRGKETRGGMGREKICGYAADGSVRL